MKIAYVHGFASSGQTKIVDIMRKHLPEDEIISYDIPVEPNEAIDFLLQRLYEDKIDVAIGTSLGAYYLLHTSVCKKIAINPPYDPNKVLDQFIDKEVEFLNPRKDGAKSFYWKEVYHKQIEFYNEWHCLCDFEIQDDSTLFFGVGDDFVTDNDDYQYGWDKYHIPGGHRFTEEMLVDYIIPQIDEYRN